MLPRISRILFLAAAVGLLLTAIWSVAAGQPSTAGNLRSELSEPYLDPESRGTRSKATGGGPKRPPAEPPAPAAAAEATPDTGEAAAASRFQSSLLVASLTIFVLAIFVGFEVITKVPPTLHTPLMSGSNAISGIAIVGALFVTGAATGGVVSTLIGTLAIILATINVVGGFLVTHRMLAMFQRK